MYKNLKAEKQHFAPLIKVNGKGQIYLSKPKSYKLLPQVRIG